MNNLTRVSSIAVLVVSAVSLSACSNMTHRDKATAAGAAIGGVAGSVLSNGSALGTVGGAAVGGVVGNEVGKRK
ncbi:glycine zipper 2TM domain-containing protein [Piscinibacter sakaiensis]|uniref:glycine zipper 2TM domain-containing protein n=1 Tax=Piscinibacter sakaiensis TaxID=1547922 RepID=UPI003AABF14A